MLKSKVIVVLVVLPKTESEEDNKIAYKKIKLCTKSKNIVPEHNTNYGIKIINTDVFKSDDLPLQGSYQNVLCSDENKNYNVNQAFKGKTRVGNEQTNVSQTILPQTYNKPNPIGIEKKCLKFITIE